MADQTFRKPDPVSSGSQQRFEDVKSGMQNVADQGRSAGRDMKEKATQVVGSSSEALKDRMSDVSDSGKDMSDTAKDVASQATEKLKETVEGQKNVGAEYVGK